MDVLGDPSALTFVVSAVLWVLVAWVPGTLVVSAVFPLSTLLQRLAVAPLVSIGVGFSAGSWAGVVGLGRPVDVVLVALASVTLVCAVVVVRRDSPVPGRLRRAAADRTNQVVGSAIGLVVVLWTVSIARSAPGLAAVAPNSDGNAHGARVARILLTGSLDPSAVNVFDLESASPSEFYPLGIHALAAQVARVVGSGPSLMVALTLVASVALCLGSAALGRSVGGPRTAAAAAVSSALLVPFATYGQVWWGPVPFQVAMTSVPALAVLVLAARGRGGLAAAALAWAGMLGLHLSEVLVSGLLVALTLVLARGSVRARARSLVGPAGSFAFAMVIAGPTVVGILTQVGRTPQDPTMNLPPVLALLNELLHPYLVMSQAAPVPQTLIVLASGALAVATIIGCYLAWNRSVGRAVVLTWLAVAALGVAAYVTSPGLVTVPWYGNGDRVSAQAAGLLPVLLGTGLLAVARAARTRRAASALLAVASTAVALVMAVQTVVASSQAISDYAVVTPDDRAAFAWLATHVDPDRRVLNDHRDGSPWMYDATGGTAPPVFAIKPAALFLGNPDFAGRLYLRDTITRIAVDPKTQEEARRWRIQFVMVGARSYPDIPPMVPDGADPAGLTLVFRSGDARVYRLDDLP